MTPEERELAPHYVYRLFDESGQLLYVGCTYDYLKRLREHSRDNPHWFPLVDSISVQKYTSPGEAYRAEAAAHASEAPLRSINPSIPRVYLEAGA